MGGDGNIQELKDFQKYINQLIDMDIHYNTIKDTDLNKKNKCLYNNEKTQSLQTIVHQCDL